jgi:hypothetical protein
MLASPVILHGGLSPGAGKRSTRMVNAAAGHAGVFLATPRIFLLQRSGAGS